KACIATFDHPIYSISRDRDNAWIAAFGSSYSDEFGTRENDGPEPLRRSALPFSPVHSVHRGKNQAGITDGNVHSIPVGRPVQSLRKSIGIGPDSKWLQGWACTSGKALCQTGEREGQEREEFRRCVSSK